MNLRLPEDLERFVASQVQSGRFASSQEAVRLLQRQEEVEEGIRQGLDDMRAGRGLPRIMSSLKSGATSIYEIPRRHRANG